MNLSDYEKSHVPLCVAIPDKELDGLANIHVELNALDNTQECLSKSYHKIALTMMKTRRVSGRVNSYHFRNISL